MLQIEIFRRDGLRLSKSVTRETDFAELLLQIEINRQAVHHPPTSRFLLSAEFTRGSMLADRIL